MEKVKKGIIYSVIASEGIHIFCCVLPTIFSIMSLMAGIGIITIVPGFVDNMHGVLHHYEIPMIITSAIILAIGWALYVYAQQLDCNEDSQICCHEPCAPKKDRTKMIMIFATVLFAVNVSVYFAFHWKSEQNSHGYEVHVEDQLGNHHNHNH